MMVPKFRAWDKITKRYYSVETWHMEDEYVDLIESNKSTADPNAKRFWRRISEVILEQSTGMKDANGKEIYEGDILATASRIGRKLITDYLKVDWREDYAGFFCGEKPLYVCLSEWNNDIKYPQTFPEIVGNVHTDGDLVDS